MNCVEAAINQANKGKDQNKPYTLVLIFKDASDAIVTVVNCDEDHLEAVNAEGITLFINISFVAMAAVKR